MTNKQKTGLGKGLGALLPSIEFSDKGFRFVPPENEEQQMAFIEVSKIKHNPYQPRREFDKQALEDLKSSIIEHGVIQPITVRRTSIGFELISGERRYRASIEAGLTKVPAYILEIKSDVEMLELAIIENVQRENLNPIEIANGYFRLIEECGLTQEQVAHKVAKDRTTITNFLRLLRLPEKVQESLRKKEISMGHARAMLALKNDKDILPIWKETLDKSLSVRAVEELIRNFESGKIKLGLDKKQDKNLKPEKAHAVISHEIEVVLEENINHLQTIFGTRVRIHPKTSESGTFEFDFYSLEDFDRLMDIFNSVKIK